MPHTAGAFADGDLTVDQVDLLCRANQPRVADEFAHSEQHLVESAMRLGYRDLLRVVRYWQQHADPDGADQQARRAHDGREVYATRTFAASIDLRGSLDPISGTVFLNELERLEQQLFEADWADAREGCGDIATVEDLARTPAQRRHDALVEMARRSAAKPKDANPARPLITVLVGYENFTHSICELADGTVIPPSSILSLLDETDIERIVFHPTTIENARLLCPLHNRRRPGRRAPPGPEAA
jgi:hypothetical protein